MKIDTNVQNAQIAQVAAAQAALNREDSTGNQKVAAEKNANADRQDAADQISLNITVSKRTLETIGRLGEVSDVLNSMAKSLRQTDQSLKLSSELIARMKDELSRIVKNFPPFPVDSRERRDLLMSYQAIQKEIIKMSVPTPPPPAYERVQHMWQDLIPGLDGKVVTPDLPETASDSQVRFAVDALGAIQERIAGVRAELGASVA